MALAQLNKESILKHKFWILLLAFLILWIVSMCILQATASGPLEDKRRKYEAAKKKVENASKQRPKNENFLKPWQDYAKSYADQKESVWKEAWDLQKDMVSWPSSTTAPFRNRWDTSPTFVDFLKRVGEVSDQPKGWNSGLARNEFKDLYHTQFKDLEKQVKPVELNGGTDAIFQPVAWSDKPPLIEEIWLAQEDLWVRTELLGIVRSVLDAVAKFERLPRNEKEKLPPGIRARHRFRNSSWELDLLIEQQGKELQISPKSQIKNVHITKRLLPLANPRTNKGLLFRLRQGSAAPFLLQVEGEPLAYGQSTQLLKPTVINTIQLLRPFDLEQVFDWETAPVRRIDALELAKHSHRTSTHTLEANPALAVADKEVPAAPAGPPGSTPPPPAPSPPPPTPGGPPAGQPAAGGAGTDATPSGLKRSRYIRPTEQCRHMPVGMLVIVDQAHVHDMLIAVANSPLRIQITQVGLQHVGGIAPPPLNETAETSAPGVRPRAAGTGDRPGTQPKPAARAGGDDPNLVELAIYGIATLYERFPENRPVPRSRPMPSPAPAATPGTGPPTAGTGSTTAATPPPGQTASPGPAEAAKGAANKGTDSPKETPAKGAPQGNLPRAGNDKAARPEDKSKK